MRKLINSLWRIISAPFRLILWIIKVSWRWWKQLFKDITDLFTTEVEDESLTDTVTKTLENPMGLMDHIDALRKHILRSIIALFITTSISFLFTQQIIDFLAQPVGGLTALRAIDVTEPIGVFMRVALLSGFTLALPYITLELWLFVAPGLKRKSRLFSLIAIPIAAVLFFSGMTFAYFVMLPVGVPFLISVLGIPAELRPSSYVRFVTGVMFWIGAAFEFPLLIYTLAMIGFVKAKFLLEQWRLAIVIIAIMAAAITPTIDPVNMAIVMGPLIILYFMGIGFAFIAQRSHTIEKIQ